MSGYRVFPAVFGVLSLFGCTSDPNASVNQMFPIRQMDHFFDSLSRPSLPPDYTRLPGYAPAYPPIQLNGSDHGEALCRPPSSLGADAPAPDDCFPRS